MSVVSKVLFNRGKESIMRALTQLQTQSFFMPSASKGRSARSLWVSGSTRPSLLGLKGVIR